MKTKKQKLNLSKERIATLDVNELNSLQGRILPTRKMSVCPTYVPTPGMKCCGPK